ncbi:serine acetyltransferase [Aldersonia sp. NBC_00410]|uniref:serine acetyltransferase n=1 Tax=Aldersonia sp. NBC_00410 TaxID=2975954 RepID=UPI002253EC77|nr:serine acetyltransferase [Aldersonia sp. NBC_00410]MCX5041688.1 serine acetyltransferase [Aldersonia sp. NBC_00410]
MPTDRALRIAAARLWTYPLWRAVTRSAAGEIVAYEVDRWIECIGDDGLRRLQPYARFAYLAAALPEFRTLLHYRLRGSPSAVRLVLRAVYRPAPSLLLDAKFIGQGLFVQHGLATVVSAEQIGRDCWINQQVTVGYDRRGRPTIGDHVRIGAGAVVVGNITVHDGATVGANATVVHDVPAGQTVVAPLARPLILPTSTDDQGRASTS